MEGTPRERERQLKGANTGRSLPLIAFLCCLGLLCHLFIFLSLSFTFIEANNGYEPNWIPVTGWQLLYQWEGPKGVLWAALLLPLIPYLLCLLLFPVKSMWKWALLETGFYLNGILNIIGFALLTTLAWGWNDLHSTYRTDAAYTLSLGAFLLSLLCSCSLLVHCLRRPERERWISALVEGGEAAYRRIILPRFSRERKRPLILLGVLCSLSVLIGASWVEINHSLSGFLGPNGGVSGSIAWNLSPGEEFAFDVSVENVSDKTITLHAVTLPSGSSLPIQLSQEFMKSSYPVGHYDEITTLEPIPVEGYRLTPKTEVTITLVVAATKQGAYRAGPVTVHAEVPFLFTTVQVSNTYTQYAFLCVQVGYAVCESFQEEMSQQPGGYW